MTTLTDALRRIFHRFFRRRPKGPAVDVMMLGADASVRITFGRDDAHQ